MKGYAFNFVVIITQSRNNKKTFKKSPQEPDDMNILWWFIMAIVWKSKMLFLNKKPAKVYILHLNYTDTITTSLSFGDGER